MHLVGAAISGPGRLAAGLLPRAHPRRGARPRLTGSAALAAPAVLLLAFGVVGWQHVLHATVLGHGDAMGGHLLHWLRDAALATPLAMAAVVGGLWLARRLGEPRSLAAALLLRSSVISLLFVVLLVPSGVVHDAIDEALAGPGVGRHGVHGDEQGTRGHEHDGDLGLAGVSTQQDPETAALDSGGDLAGQALHGLRDALVAHPVALLLAVCGLILTGTVRRRDGPLHQSEPTAGWAANGGPGGRRRGPCVPLRPAAVRIGLVVALVGLGNFGGFLARPAEAAPAGVCPTSAPDRTYNVSAINLRITYNRFGDQDPGAFMYVLDENIQAVRAQEASNQVSAGLRKDPIQPLVIRANLGDCVHVNFTNRLTKGLGKTAAPAVGISVHGLSTAVDSFGSAVGNNADSQAPPGQTITYHWYVEPSGPEGGHVFHAHGDSRQIVAHGLFGTIIAEPAGSSYLDPENGQPLSGSNWEAVITDSDPNTADFREFVIIYHDVGDEQFTLDGLPIQDFNGPSGAYRPGARALNYRSEPFLDRLELVEDKSLAYSSYAYGDPATPIPRSYLGEPTKTRVMHAGTEMAHLHHLHGGANRWPRNPEAAQVSTGLDKSANQDTTSVRLDVQLINPTEAYDLEHEGGAGGRQQAAGDFLFHCHIAHHYIAGMWGIWRVFDTAQPDLAKLPDRAAAPTAVSSVGLIGKVIEGKTVVPRSQLTDPSTQRALEDWVETQLPPQGARIDREDATVWDWVKEGTQDQPLYRGEPDDTRTWANYSSSTPGQRPEILFNPSNGRYTWPLFRPHLGMRPPFAPRGHSGAPWLGETASTTRADGLCPAGAPVRTYHLTAVTLAMRQLDSGNSASDPNGQIYVLNEDRAAVLNGSKPPEPLAIRSNVGDCVAGTLSSQLVDNAENRNHSKVNLHTHFVQFDPQASDGVITGFSYEQSVNPYAEESRTLSGATAAGATQISVSQISRLRVGIYIAVGQGQANLEIRKIAGISGTTLTLDTALDNAHAAGEAVGVEFVQYRWFSDVDSGTVFFHDHVDGIHSWDHGLFGAHIIEPAGSTYHDPATGTEVRSGAIVDIHAPPTASVGAGQSGSFREFALFLHDDRRSGGCTDGARCGSINLRAEPLGSRGGNTDPYAFSSVRWNDPFTPLPRAYVGDPFVIRTLGLVEKEGALRVTGHRFRVERFNSSGVLMDAMTTGIAERFDYVLDGGAGGPAGNPGDYLYYSTTQHQLEEGAWGIMRVHDTLQSTLQPLPGRTAPPSGGGFPQLTFTGAAPPQATSPGQPCPAGAPVRTYDVTAFAKALPNGQRSGVIYALSADVPAIQNGSKPVEPLAIRANAGDCIEITLRNQVTTKGTRAGLSPGLVLFDPQGSYGAAIGFNPDSTVAPNANYTYRLYADRELGTAIWLNLGNLSTMLEGAYGALVIEPTGSTYHDPATGGALTSGLRADIHTAGGNFREFVVLFHDQDIGFGASTMPYETSVDEPVALNYQRVPARGGDPSLMFSSTVHGDPPTTLFRAYPGDAVRFRASAPVGQQPYVFSVDGHQWPLEPQIPGSDLLTSRNIGPGQTLEAALNGGAGGPQRVAGDYLYLNHRYPYTQAGLWGIFRVHGSQQPDLQPL